MKKDLSLQVVENDLQAYQMYHENTLESIKKYIEYNYKFQKITVSDTTDSLVLTLGGDDFNLYLEFGRITLTLNDDEDMWWTFETAQELFESLEGLIDEEYS